MSNFLYGTRVISATIARIRRGAEESSHPLSCDLALAGHSSDERAEILDALKRRSDILVTSSGITHIVWPAARKLVEKTRAASGPVEVAGTELIKAATLARHAQMLDRGISVERSKGKVYVSAGNVQGKNEGLVSFVRSAGSRGVSLRRVLAQGNVAAEEIKKNPLLHTVASPTSHYPDVVVLQQPLVHSKAFARAWARVAPTTCKPASHADVVASVPPQRIKAKARSKSWLNMTARQFRRRKVVQASKQ